MTEKKIIDTSATSTIKKKGNNRSLGARLLSGGLWMVLSRAVQALSGMLVSILLARMLTPEEMGTYFILISIVLLGSMLAQFGTHQSIVKLIASGMAIGDEATVRRTLRSVFLLAVFGSITIVTAYMFGGALLLSQYVFKSDQIIKLAELTAMWIVLKHAQELLSNAFRGFHDLRRAAFFDGAQTQLLTIITLLIIWFTIQNPSIYDAVCGSLVAYAFTLFSGAFLLWRYHWRKLKFAHGLLLRRTIRLSAPLFVSSTFFLALGEMHLWILGAMSAPDQVAIYGASFRLMRLVQLPLTLINNVIPPSVAELFAQKQIKKLERLLRATASLIALPALFLLSLLLFFAEDLLGVIYGDYFRSAANVLSIMAVGQAVNVWTGSPGVLLAMSDQQGLLMRASVGAGIIALLLSMVLVRDYGAGGVAIGYASGLILQNVVMTWFAWRKLGIKTFAGFGQFGDACIWLRSQIKYRMRSL